MKADDLQAAKVEGAAVGALIAGSGQERLDGIVHVREVAKLGSFPDLEGFAANELTDPDPKERLACVADSHMRSVGVGQPQGAGTNSVDVVVEDVVRLAGCLVDAVDVHGSHQVLLVHGHVLRAAVDLPRAGEDDLDVGIELAAGFENRQLGPAVDLQVGLRIDHRIQVAGLARQIEQEVVAADEVPQAVLVSNVGDVDLDAAGELGDVEEVAAVLGYQAIDERDVGAVFNESTGEVRSDEAQPTGHKYPLAGEVAHRPVAENRKPL